MEAITKKATQEELSEIYVEAHEMIAQVDELNNTMSVMDPMLDELNRKLDSYKIKSTRIRHKLSQIMTKI